MNKFNRYALGVFTAHMAVLLLGMAAGAGLTHLAHKKAEQPPFTAHVDDDTGCEYLITREGHITPRLHADGLQVCMGEDQLAARLPDYHEGHSPDYYESADEVYVSPLPILPPHKITEQERQP